MSSAPAQQAAPEVSPPLRRGARLWLDHLRVERGHSDHTVAAYRRDLERYLHYLAGQQVTSPEQVTEQQVAAFLTWLRTPTPERPALAPSSAARALVAVRGWHRFLVLEGETPADPAREVGPAAAPCSQVWL
ncbi:site-specific integrase [Ornithinicoccus halotolerans]|uniref:site-specific integrase n=1 Tax=Ornithinicoccus halotolerans TaxID=1748220 RepID=UPI0012963C13|nr:site-specific integrase [Ornithinicoccus halotolerans]